MKIFQFVKWAFSNGLIPVHVPQGIILRSKQDTKFKFFCFYKSKMYPVPLITVDLRNVWVSSAEQQNWYRTAKEKTSDVPQKPNSNLQTSHTKTVLQTPLLQIHFKLCILQQDISRLLLQNVLNMAKYWLHTQDQVKTSKISSSTRVVLESFQLMNQN